MFKANWMALFATGMLLPMAGLADDAQTTDSEPLPIPTLSRAALLAELEYASRWHLLPTAKAKDFADERPRHFTEFGVNFRDDNAMMRATRTRNLSLLTVAEFHKTRLFFGVNSDGVLGLHFNAFRRHGDARYLEVFRMPYVKDTTPGHAAHPPGPE